MQDGKMVRHFHNHGVKRQFHFHDLKCSDKGVTIRLSRSFNYGM